MAKAKKKLESAVLTMSDIHYGAKTSSYNPDVFGKRMDTLGAKLGQIRSLLSEYEFEELVVMLLGDANDGSDIYATQPHHQAITDVNAQAEELADYLASWMRDQKDVWGNVRIECVPGNHGRVSRFAHEAANWDTVAYTYLRKNLSSDGIQVCQGRGDNLFVRKVKVRGHDYLLYHGHEIRTFSSIPWYGMMLRLSRWATTRKYGSFDMAIMGHFHSFGMWDINRIPLLASGTMKSDDMWALQTLGWESATKWHLFGVSDSRPMTWHFGLELAD